ncbi:MAG TPA: DUF4127 family protein, partial [Syntrophomonas sp.]|nr:DUF4127 family protein [Syntrophomonas sp.]
KVLSLLLCLALMLSVMQFSAVTALADTEAESPSVTETTPADTVPDTNATAGSNATDEQTSSAETVDSAAADEQTVPAETGGSDVTDDQTVPESGEAVDDSVTPEDTITEKKPAPFLAYVPLDNRPVNDDRVIYEAEAAGFKVIMPNEDWYTTRLDGQPLNANDTQFGDSEKLMEWILLMDQATDYFVISLDQLLSGGLVNSRVLYGSKYAEEYKMIDAIINLSKTNHVYIIDTVARLATCTVGYQGASLDTYNYLREYNATPRKVLSGGSLTVKNIVSGYKYNEKGTAIATKSSYNSVVKNSLRSRERKLHLIDYMLNQDKGGSIKYFIGIDDSNSENTIQTNEVNYIKKIVGDRGFIYSGTDELGMMAVLRLMIDHYGSNVNAAAIYFGNTEDYSAGSIYDMETVKENVEEHLKSIGVNQVAPGQADLEILVLTLPAKSVLNSKYISAMIDHVNDNVARGMPTIVINSAPTAYSSNLEYRMVRECEMSMLLAYSSWGTVGNSIGLALGNGISRYLYLQSRNSSSDAADIAFLKGLIFSFEKDISYLRSGGQTLFNEYITAKGWPTSNFYQNDVQVKTVFQDLENILKTYDYNVTVNDIINNLTDCRYLKGLGGECGIIGDIDLTNYSTPFFRTYEMRFDIDVKIGDETINNLDNAMTISMPYTPTAGQLVYSLTLYGRDKSGKLQKIPCVYDKTEGLVKFSAAANQYSGLFVDTLTMDAEQAYGLFTDADKSAWYFDYVIYVYEKGMMRGVSSNTFEPGTPMTRAMLVNTLYRMAGTPEAASAAILTDVSAESWYKPAVDWALANKIVSGYADGTFGPDDPITREQLAVLLWRYMNYAGLEIKHGGYSGIAAYEDAYAIAEVMRNGFDWACSNGIITGTTNNGTTLLMPNASATRAEVAAVLKRFVDMGISLPDNTSADHN